MTDYTAVPLDDIMGHLREWEAACEQDAHRLSNIGARIARHAPDHMATAGVAFCEYFSDWFLRYRADLARLRAELPNGVRDRHLELLRQLYRGSKDADDTCVCFKRDHRLDALTRDNELQHTLAEAYRVARDGVVNMFDLSNLIPRLRTFATEVPEVHTDPTDVLELKPNFFGLGFNLNYVIKLLRKVNWRPWRASHRR
jgi:hypothetical protein